jgi:hypothetical protein
MSPIDSMSRADSQDLRPVTQQRRCGHDDVGTRQQVFHDLLGILNPGTGGERCLDLSRQFIAAAG